MNDVLKYLAALPFTQLLILTVTIFAMVMALIMVIAKFAKMSGIEKISTKGIEFDTDGAPIKKPARRRRIAKK